MSQTGIALDLPLEADDFKKYMEELETFVLAAIVSNGTIGKRDTIPVRVGRLSRTVFGQKIGLTFESDVSFAVDYYGMLKKSTSLCKEIEWVQEQFTGTQVKTVESLIIHFASVRIEHVARFCPNLIAGFPNFKRTVLEARGFKPKF